MCYLSVPVLGLLANAPLCVNLLHSQALTAPPYNFGPVQVRFANFGLAVGALLGLLTAGPFSDWIAALATKCNGGVREAEMQLPIDPFHGLGPSGHDCSWCRLAAILVVGSSHHLGFRLRRGHRCQHSYPHHYGMSG